MFRKIKRHELLAISFIMFAIFVLCNIGDVVAFTSHGEGELCLNVDLNTNDFPVSSVIVNNAPWDKEDDHEYRTGDNYYTIVVKAGKKEGKDGYVYPQVSTAGGFDEYGTVEARPNPDEDELVEGDEYIFTIVLDNMPYNGQNDSCSGFGFSLEPGDEPKYVTEETANISISISGAELEYHYVADKPDEADVTYFKFGIGSAGIDSINSEYLVPFTFGNANYVYNDGVAPHNVSSVSTKEDIVYNYSYDNTGYVTFCVNGGQTDNYTKIEINDVDYANQAPHTQQEVFEHIQGRALMFCIDNIPYNKDGYNVVVEGSKLSDEKTVAGFGWSYLSRERSNLSEEEAEGNFAHGRLEFVSAKYTDIDNVEHEFNSVSEYNNARYHGTGEIYAWEDGRKDYGEEDRREAWGSALVPYGTELTVRVVPDEGYQLTSFSTSPNGFQATDEAGVYKIVLTKENFNYSVDDGFNLEPVFTLVGNEVRNGSEAIKAGTIQTDQQVTNGSIKLEVNDVNVSEESRTSFEETLEEGYTINNYLDLSLYNTIYKGGKKDENNNYLSWDTEINNLTNNATITLELEDNMDGKDIIVIHEEHKDNKLEYVVIEPTYFSDTNTISFETKSFSNYAIASKGGSNEQNDPENPEQPESFEIFFNSCGGTEVPSVHITSGDLVDEPENVTNGNQVLVGWYTEEEYENKYDFNTKVTSSFTLFAKWEEPAPVDYNVNDEGGNKIEFEEQASHTFTLSIFDYASLTDEQIDNNPNFTREEYEAGLAIITNTTQQYGKLIAAYEIEVVDEDDHAIHEGPFTIRLKLTEEMKKYNSFKMVYLNDSMEVEEIIEFKIEGDYLVGILPHLSMYVLTGSNVATNPGTGDNIISFVAMLGISLGGIIIINKYSKKKKYN